MSARLLWGALLLSLLGCESVSGLDENYRLAGESSAGAAGEAGNGGQSGQGGQGGDAGSGGSAVCTQTMCGEACVNTASDASHCGGCDQPCPTGAFCSNSQCACGANEALCNGQCFNTKSSDLHCGGCDNACTLPDTCKGGMCK